MYVKQKLQPRHTAVGRGREVNAPFRGTVKKQVEEKPPLACFRGAPNGRETGRLAGRGLCRGAAGGAEPPTVPGLRRDPAGASATAGGRRPWFPCCTCRFCSEWPLGGFNWHFPEV